MDLIQFSIASSTMLIWVWNCRSTGQSQETATTNPSNWELVAEGGAHAVFRYVGCNAQFQGTVLRATKQGHELDRATADISAPHCFRVALGEYIPESVPVPTTVAMQQGLNAVLQTANYRSELRSGDILSVKVHHNTLAPDLTRLPAPAVGIPVGPLFAFELKPKAGVTSHISSADCWSSVLSNVSRFRMQQVQKVCDGIEPVMSDYEPSDLFSGSYSRVVRSLWSLFAAPQNNLRVFLNGERLHPQRRCPGDLAAPSRSRSGEWFPHEVNDAVRHAFTASAHSIGAAVAVTPNIGADALSPFYARLNAQCAYTRWLVCVLSGILQHEPVLRHIQELQGLDYAGPHLIAEAARLHLTTPEFKSEAVQSSDAVLWMRRWLRDFMTAAVAKDLSVMVSFRLIELPVDAPLPDTSGIPPARTSGTDEVVEDDVRKPHRHIGYIRLDDAAGTPAWGWARGLGKDIVVEYSLGVVDLDPKPVRKALKYVVQEQGLIRQFLEESCMLHTVSGVRAGFGTFPAQAHSGRMDATEVVARARAALWSTVLDALGC